MKPGRTAMIRVNPKDCMGVADVMKLVGMEGRGLSFAASVSVALGALMETARKNNLIPTRTGFEYNELMQIFPPDKSKRKLEAAALVRDLGPQIQMPQLSPIAASPYASMTTEQIAQRLDELQNKERTEIEEIEYQELERQLYK